MKYLAIVERTADGFRGYAHRLPGCEVEAATEKEAEAGIIASFKKYVADGKAGVNGLDNGEVEVFVAIDVPPKRPRDDGLDDLYDEARKLFRPEDLEFYLHLDEQEWVPAEQLRRKLEEIASRFQ